MQTSLTLHSPAPKAPAFRRAAADLIDRLVPLPFIAHFLWPWELVCLAYDLHCDTGGASLGKRLLGLEVRIGNPPAPRHGRPCCLPCSLVRNGLWCLARLCHASVAFLPLGLARDLAECLLILFQPQGRRLGDLIAGTQVVAKEAICQWVPCWSGRRRRDAREYEESLPENLAALSERLCEERFVPAPLRHGSIPKKTGGERELAIPTVEDRIVQRALVDALEPQWEPLFLPCSFGYRPGRGVADAIERVLAYRAAGFRWLVDADVSDFFPSVDHELLLARVAEPVSDRGVRRLIALSREAGALGPPEPPVNEKRRERFER
jgi:hypothetical protein